jgi:hypothetical protein
MVKYIPNGKSSKQNGSRHFMWQRIKSYHLTRYQKLIISRSVWSAKVLFRFRLGSP